MDTASQGPSTETNELPSVPKNSPVEPRNAKGQLKKGSKLGTGRKKGSKNKATILRERMENKVSIRLSKMTPKVVNKVIEQALEADGCRQSQKMILDRAIPIRKADDGSADKSAAVQITITNLTRENVHDEVDITGECELVED